MEENLLNLTTKKLLDKFGAGNHKPGSGSAAAFQGMLSAKLLVTVISLTNEENRRETYARYLPKLLQMDSDIQSRIFPELVRLFNEDSIQFGKTIRARKARNTEKDPIEKAKLSRQALTELKIAIDIPLAIAELNVVLAEMATFVFDYAFKSARGDSQVALSGAVAAIGGCLSIVQLNLLSYWSDEYDWMEDTQIKADELKETFKTLNSIATSKIEILESEVKGNMDLYKELNQILSQSKGKRSISYADIENYARQLQLLAWKHRDKIWKKKKLTNPIEMLNPSVFFKSILGYDFQKQDELGLNDGPMGLSDVAGIIDQKKKVVLISNLPPKQTQHFTAAHELGHAILHKQTVLHRDLPIDGAGQTGKRSIQELQADKFAAFFLMPRKQVIKAFEERFLTDKFVIDQNTAFNLTQSNPSKLITECQNKNGLCRKLAGAESFAGESFKSLAELFSVSVGAMAIRIEELKLVEF